MTPRHSAMYQPIAAPATKTMDGMMEAAFLGAVGILLPMVLRHPQLVVGVAVNFALVAAALRASSLAATLPLVLLPSIAAVAGGVLLGAVPPAGLVLLIPAIWGGNLAQVVLVRAGAHRTGFATALMAATAAKGAVIAAGVIALQAAGSLPAGFATAFMPMILLTALAGGAMAYPAAAAWSRYVRRQPQDPQA